MGARIEHHSARTVVVGSGPGGATVARELARRGHDVLVLERGAYHKPVGNWLTMLRMLDRPFGMLFSVEGTQMVRLLTVGGSTVSFCGVAMPPPAWFKDKYGIDLSPHVDEAVRELGLAPLPERLVGGGAKKIRAAASEEGFDWRPLMHFIHVEKCDLSCPKCMIGCAKEAKWTAREYVEEALGVGGRLMTKARVEKVLSDGGRVTGVRGEGRSGPFVVDSENVVLAAGGLGSPMVLQASGIAEVGRGFFIDPLCLTSGISRGPGSCHDIPMSCGTTDLQDEGIIMTDQVDPWPLFFFGLVMGGPRHPRNFVRYPKTLGILTKVRDPLTGTISADGSISKPLGDEELQKLARGQEIATKILCRAGCDPATILSSPPRGAHPGGTVRIGEGVDSDLQTEISGLYVCDASVIPEPYGMPPVLTIIGLGKRLVNERLAEASSQ